MKHIMTILISVFSLGYHGKTIDFEKYSPCHRTTVAHFLNKGKWDDGKLEDILKSTVIQFIYKEAQRSGKPVFCIVDDTISSKTKPSSQALHPIEDAYFPQSHLKGKQDYGHQAVAVMLSCNDIVLNYAIVMYDKSKSKIMLQYDNEERHAPRHNAYMKTVLKVGTPISATYSHTAHLLAIIAGQNALHPWLMNCFIQIYGETKDYMDFQDFGLLDCPLIHTQHIGLDMVADGWQDKMQFIRNAIRRGYYIYAELNVSKISVYQRTAPYAHDALIYGFDDEAERYLIADFFNGKKYGSAWVTYEEIENALYCDEGAFGKSGIFFDDIFLLKYKEDSEAVFYPENVKESLQRYLDKKPVEVGYNRFKPYSVGEVKSYIFGTDCYDLVFGMVEDVRRGISLPTRWKHIVHLLYEHKRIMLTRIGYMGENHFLKNAQKYMERYKAIEMDMLIVRYLFLRYFVTGERELMRDIDTLVNNVKETESIIFGDMLRDIKV